MNWFEYPAKRVYEALRVMEEGMAEMHSGEFKQAERTFDRALSICPVPAIFNNLATVYMHTDRCDEALAVLEGNLARDDTPNPYAHALGSRCLLRLDEPERARVAAENAVEHFEAGPQTGSGRESSRAEAGWYEYATPILKAFGDLGEHRRVWRLYQDWKPGIRDPIARYYAGIAAFNLGYLGRAEALWLQLRNGDWKFLERFCLMARLCGDEDFPMPALTYELPASSQQVKEILSSGRRGADSELIIEWFLIHPPDLFLLLNLVLSGEVSRENAGLLRELVAHGGEWGEEFGRKLLLSNRFPYDFKMAAAAGLADRGVLEAGAPVKMMLDGKPHHVILRPVRVSLDATCEMVEHHERIGQLVEGDELQRAREEIEHLIDSEDEVWAGLVMLYAEVLRRLKDFDEAETWLELLAEQQPDNPAVQINLARVRAAQGRHADAEALLCQLDLRGVPPDARREMERVRDNIRNLLRLRHGPDLLLGRSHRQIREEAEERRVHPGRTTLRSALRKVPVKWLNTACRLHGLPDPASRRPEREEQLAEWILEDPARMLANLADEEPDRFGDLRALLTFLLERGGWAEKGRVALRFGSDDNDEFFRSDDLPDSALGLSRMAGLVFVGQTNVKKELRKVAVIPVDLRAPLREVLEEM
ncbi:MAG: tetratricopeptide repeat protein [Bacillota bacterium]